MTAFIFSKETVDEMLRHCNYGINHMDNGEYNCKEKVKIANDTFHHLRHLVEKGVQI